MIVHRVIPAVLVVIAVLLAGANLKASGLPVTVTAVLSIDDYLEVTSGDSMELAVLRDLESGQISLTWRKDSGWLGIWRLWLSVTEDLNNGKTPLHKELLALNPRPDHRYQFALSYDPDRGQVTILVVDLIDGRNMCYDTLSVAPGRSLVSVTKAATPGASLTTSTCNIPLPGGISWQWNHMGSSPGTDGLPTVISPPVLNLLLPESVGGQITMKMTSTTLADTIVRSYGHSGPVELPPGLWSIELAYTDGDQSWLLDRRQVKLVEAIIQVETRLSRAGQYLAGEIHLASDQTGTVHLQLLADVLQWQFDEGRWEPVAEDVLILDEAVSFVAGTANIVSFSMDDPAKDAPPGTIYRIDLRCQSVPAEQYEWVLSEQAALTWEGFGGHRYSGNQHFVRAGIGSEPAKITTMEELREERRRLANRPRRILWNNDGNDALRAGTPTPHAMLLLRNYPTAVSQVDTIFYCPWKVGIVNTTRRTEIGYPFTYTGGNFTGNTTGQLHALGTDPLQVTVEFARRHDLEVFWSLRMNDTHDIEPDFPAVAFVHKAQHPEYLIGSDDDRPFRGRWTAWDYAHPEVRETVFLLCQEVCQNYDVDGIELDFFRHPQYFRGPSFDEDITQAELELMTELMRRIRAMTEVEGLRRGKPILVAVRVPDSVEFCRDIGLDIETWLSEGLVDILITGGYFQLNPWEYSVALARKYDVPVYASLDPSRFDEEPTRFSRNSLEGYRARAAAALAAGVDGIYLFNLFDTRLPHFQSIGAWDTLEGKDKYYFANYQNRAGRRPTTLQLPIYWLATGAEYQNVPTLSRTAPIVVTRHNAAVLEVFLGADVADDTAQSTLFLELSGVTSSEELVVQINDSILTGKVVEGWGEYSVPRDILKQGANTVSVSLSGTGTQVLQLLDLIIVVSYNSD